MSLENLDKLNYNIPLMSPESVLSSNGDNIPTVYNQGSIKRPRTEDYSDVGLYPSSKPTNYLCSENRSYSRPKTFLTVRHNNYIYHTEDWRPKGCTRYIPLHEDIMINTQNIEQISFECDQFFLADEKGNYVGAKPAPTDTFTCLLPTTKILSKLVTAISDLLVMQFTYGGLIQLLGNYIYPDRFCF